MHNEFQLWVRQHRLILGAAVTIILLSCAGSAATPLPPLTTTSSASVPTATSTPYLEVAENMSSSNTDPRGEIKLEYPLRMRPGSSDSVYVSIHIPAEVASLQPIEIGRVEIPSDAPPIIGKINSYQATILVSQVMRVELFSPTFKIQNLYPLTQPINLKAVAEPTFWGWTIEAPNTPGDHVLTVQVYRGDDSRPSWVRSLMVEVVELTPLSTPVPFMYTPGGTIVLGGGIVIIIAIIVIIGFVVVRQRSARNTQAGEEIATQPADLQASYYRTLKTLNGNLAHLLEQAALHGMDVPLEITNEIEVTKQQIAEIETKLNKLDTK